MERILEMANRFVSESKYAEFVSIDPGQLLKSVVDIVSNPEGVGFVSEREGRTNGMIALLIYAHPYSGIRTAFEVVWWVDPEARGCGMRLLSAAEKWAKENGAEAMQMVAPTEKVGHLYERLGYKPVETSYQRSL